MKTTVQLLVSLFFVGALAGCGDEFDPASQVDSLRVLGVRAEPPELSLEPASGAPDRAALSTLVADPAQVADPGRRASVVYLACTGNPLDPYGGACTSFDAFRDVAALARTTRPATAGTPWGAGAVDAVTFAGIEGCVHGARCAPPAVDGAELPAPAYVVPPEMRLDLLPAGVPQRVLGLEVVVIAVAIAAAPEELLVGDEPVAGIPGRLADLLASREHVVAVKRLPIRGPDATDEPNQNPVVGGIALDGVALPAEPAGGPALARRADVELSPLLPSGADALRQPYTDYDAFGVPIAPATEDWTFSFFATAGSLDRVHVRSTEDTDDYTAPKEIPAGGEVVLYLVVRDHRGGADWTVRRVRVE
jgi:hypothetical protein